MMEDKNPTLSDFVKDTLACFRYYREGYLYYNITIFRDGKGAISKVNPESMEYWMFPIPIDDTKGATFDNMCKSIELMRWIRKALSNGTMVRYYPKTLNIN